LPAFITKSHNHRLRGSGSTVVTMTGKVNGKTEILIPCRSVTPENVEAKLGVVDYVMDPYNLANLKKQSVLGHQFKKKQSVLGY